VGRHFEDKGHWWTFGRKTDALRWVLTLVTGFFCGVAALFVTNFTKFLSAWKFSQFHTFLEQEKDGSSPFGTSFLFLFLINLLFTSVAYWTVYMEPLAAGSGKIRMA
jgi:H+/Cl- antiporter ClcA